MHEMSTRKIFSKLKKYAKKHTALSIAVFSAVVTGIAFGIKLLFYAYQTGYNFAFGIPGYYISVSDNVFYTLAVAMALLVVFGLANISGGNAMLKGKLKSHCLKTFGIVNVLVWLICISLDGLAFHQNIWLVIVASLYITFAVYIEAISCYSSMSKENKKHRYRTIREERVKKVKSLLGQRRQTLHKWKKATLKCFVSRYWCGIKKLDKKIKKLDKAIEVESVDSISEYRDIKKTNIILVMAALLIIGAVAVGYYEGATKKDIKIVSGAILNIKNHEKYDQYAVLYENEDIYLITPCEDNGNSLKLIISRQVEIEKTDIMTIRRQYKKIRK